MLSSTEKAIILSGSLFGSVFLFSTSLICLNDYLLKRNKYDLIKYDKNETDNIMLVNVSTMIFSGTIFCYFTYFGMK
jgi:hypothetical protein